MVVSTERKPPSAKATRTRAALLDAGLSIFAERPIDAVAIDQIVERAGVAKGSFFNHFADKHAFAKAVADTIRLDLESRVSAVNSALGDPFERLARGLAVAAEFALVERRRTLVMLRSADHSIGVHHPLNEGVSADIAAAVATGSTRSGVEATGVLYWLGLCQVLMSAIAEGSLTRTEVAEARSAMIVCGLTGLGLDEAAAIALADVDMATA